MTTPLLRVRGLQAGIGGHTILRGVDLDVRAGEVHAIMGPNGAGKSTLAAALAGRPDVTLEGGSAELAGQDLLSIAPEERAGLGLFLGFQYPVELPGVHNLLLLRSALNAQRRHAGLEEIDGFDFMQLARRAAGEVGLGEELLQRNVNEGFSGGEKKRNEVLQMAILQPRLAILDEIDSGLDIDAMKQVAAALQRLRSPERGLLLVTHYRRLLDLVPPDVVHVMVAGRIVASGGIELAERLERQGYEWAETTHPGSAFGAPPQEGFAGGPVKPVPRRLLDAAIRAEGVAGSHGMLK